MPDWAIDFSDGKPFLTAFWTRIEKIYKLGAQEKGAKTWLKRHNSKEMKLPALEFRVKFRTRLHFREEQFTFVSLFERGSVSN